MQRLTSRKSIALGVDDFKEIREKDWYYVDKTALIMDLIRTGSVKVKLITRPRRFGKTLNLSMLRHFFNIEGADANRKLFNGLAIENTEYMERFGAYPVIFITLKGMDGRNFDDMLGSLRQLLADLFRQYSFLLESKSFLDIELERFRRILAESEPNLEKSLLYLCELLYRHYGKKAVVLMDEYDAPIIDSYVGGYYKEAISVFRSMMSAAFKTNEYLEMGIITGVSRVTRESVFSGMNNVEVYSVLNDDFSERFGFTSDEVAAILKDYGYSDRLDEVRSYYDGYRFGEEGISKTDIYNPLSILKYAASGRLKPYWVNTASDDLIKNVALKDLPQFLSVSEILLQGGSIEAVIDDGVTFSGLNSIDKLWTLLLYAGYMTVSSHRMANRYFLRIPNEEITSYFRSLLWEIYSMEVQTPENFAELLFFNLSEFTEQLNKRLLHFSYFDLISERDYHLFLTCALLMNIDVGKGKTYDVYSNRESGQGRFDIMAINRTLNKAIVIELKHVKKQDNDTEEKKAERIENAFAAASAQASLNKYGSDFAGEVSIVTAAAYGKEFYFRRQQ